MFYLALCCTLLGIISLYVVSGMTGFVVLEEIDENMLGEKVKVKGKVMGLEERENMVFFELHKNGHSIDVVYFNSGYFNMENDFTDIVEVRGQVKDWNGKLEIVADEVLNIT